jgi:hypothetical protein
MPLEHGAVSDHIGLGAMCPHIFKNGWQVLHAAASCTRINQGVVGDNGQLSMLSCILHLLINCPDAINLLFASESLEH